MGPAGECAVWDLEAQIEGEEVDEMVGRCWIRDEMFEGVWL